MVAFSPVGRGFLTGQIKRFEDIPEKDMRRNLPRFQGDNFSANLKLVDAVKELGASKNATASQIALAWLLHQGSDITAIPGTTHVHHLEENAKAADISLSEKDLSGIKQILAEIPISGSRYSETMAKMVSAE